MNSNQTDIPLTEAIRRIAANKRTVLLCMAVGILAGIAVVVTARSIYASEIVIVPQNNGSPAGAGGLAKKLSGLASVAGISLGGGQEDSRDAAIASLSSYQTISQFLSDEGIQKKVLHEGSRRNPLALLGYGGSESMWEAVRQFREHMVVAPDKDSSLVRVQVEWFDPESASKWANQLVAITDARLRAKAISTARGRISYLQNELERNSVVSIREVISGMMENELRTLATAGADKEYAFKIIDPAVPSERAARPRRLVIVVAFALAGLLIGMISAVLFDKSRAGEKIP